MDGERRRHARANALHKMTFEWQGRLERALMTDVSEGGAFVHTEVFPPEGARLDLAYVPEGGGAGVIFYATVIRASEGRARCDDVPGVAIQWRLASTTGTPEHLHATLKQVFHAKLPVGRTKNGRAVWIATSAPVPVSSESELTFYVDRRPLRGVVRDVTRKGMTVVTSDSPPRDGAVITCRYPLTGADYARLVGVVTSTGDRGFAIELERIENPPTARFEDHVDRLVAGQCQAILREFYALTRSASALSTVG